MLDKEVNELIIEDSKLLAPPSEAISEVGTEKRGMEDDMSIMN